MGVTVGLRLANNNGFCLRRGLASQGRKAAKSSFRRSVEPTVESL